MGTTYGSKRFTPLSLSPALWLSDTGSDPSVWEDLSGNGRNATQGTAANQPAIITNALNGRQVRRFDGSNDHLITSSLSNFSDYSIFTCVRLSNWYPSDYNAIITHGYASATATLRGVGVYVTMADFEDWKKYDYLAFGSGYPATNLPRAMGPTLSGSDFRLMTSILGPSTASIFVNGTTASTRKEQTGSISPFNLPFYIGSRNLGEYLNGDIAEILVFPTALSTTNRRIVERYLAGKYGITIS